MRWFYPLFAISVVLLIVGVGRSHMSWPLVALGPVVWLTLGNSLRCPRCRTHVMESGRGYAAPWIREPELCVKCGRDRKDVWPFQWLIRPER